MVHFAVALGLAATLPWIAAHSPVEAQGLEPDAR
jgi:hypothetical protein